MSHAKPLHWIRPAMLGLAFSAAQNGLAAGTDCTEEAAGGGLASQTIDAGNITVCNDGENLYVKLTAVNGWLMTETRLAIAADGGERPQYNERLPKIGRFPHQRSYAPAIAEDTYVIPLQDAGLVPEGRLAIAAHMTAHATVHLEDEFAQRKRSENAEAGRSWASYFRYTLRPDPRGALGGGGI